MQGPFYSNTYSAPGGSSSRSSSTSYDYSGADEILKRANEANQLAVARQGQLYDGDIKGSMVGGQRIRYLLSSLKDITPVRVSSQSDSSSSNADGGSMKQEYAPGVEPPVTSSDTKTPPSQAATPARPPRPAGTTARQTHSVAKTGRPTVVSFPDGSSSVFTGPQDGPLPPASASSLFPDAPIHHVFGPPPRQRRNPMEQGGDFYHV